MRHAHLLRKTKRSEMPSQLIFVDCETHSRPVDDVTVEARLWFGWACYVRRHHGTSWSKPQWFRFESVETYWSWVSSLNRDNSRLYIYSHNQSFDFTVLQGFSQLPKYGYQLKTAVIEGPPTIITYKRDMASLVFLDTLNYFRMPLKQLGSEIKMPKLRMPTETSSRARWDAYCRRDVKVMLRAMLQYIIFLQSNDLGGYKPTLASQALSTYRHRFMQAEIYMDDHPSALALARGAYHGGRVECAHIGKLAGPLYQLDINSQYPFVMRNNTMPTRLLNYTVNATVLELAGWVKDKHCVAEVTIKTDSPAYPVYVDHKLLFPIGTFRAYLTTPEIIRALARNEVMQVHQVALYRPDNIFSDFVDFFYDARIKFKMLGEEAFYFMAKILLNSLYGKFGQSGQVYKEIETVASLDIKRWIEIDADAGEVHQYRQFGGIVQERSREGEARESHPAIAAHVTAYARLYLWSLIEHAGVNNVFYYDTDSLLVNSNGYHRLKQFMHPLQLGALKEVAIYQNVELRGAKDYSFDVVERVKGVRIKNCYTYPGGVVQDQFSNFKGMLARGDLDRALITLVSKNLTRKYNKGVVSSDGRVSPIILTAA